MNTLDGPVMEAGNPERAAIANSLAQNFPGVAKVVAVLPRHLRHVAEMVRFHLPKTEWHGRSEPPLPVLLDFVRGHRIYRVDARARRPAALRNGSCNNQSNQFFSPLPPRPLKVSSAMPDLSSSPRPSFAIFEYCLNVAAASGRSSFIFFARLSAMPESLAAWAAEKKQECSRFCMSSPSVCSTREFAPVCEKIPISGLRS